MKRTFFFQTNRLALRNLCPDDILVISAYRNDPDCSRYQHWTDLSPDEVGAFVDRFQNCDFLSREAEQHYAICLKDGSMIGELAWFYNSEDRCITWGYTIAPKYQRNGYCFELLSALIPAAKAAFPSLDLVALVEPENLPSIRLLEKLRFCRECYAEKIRSYIYVWPAEEKPEKG